MDIQNVFKDIKNRLTQFFMVCELKFDGKYLANTFATFYVILSY